MTSWWLGLDRERLRIEVERRRNAYRRTGGTEGPGVDASWRMPSRRTGERDLSVYAGLGGYEGRLRAGFRRMGEE